MCLLYNPGEIPCELDSHCPATVYCDENSGVCVSPSESDCHNEKDCGTVAFCDSDNSCVRAVNIGVPCTEGNNCGT